MEETAGICVLVSAGAEWRGLLPYYSTVTIEETPYGEYFTTRMDGHWVHFLHGGWGKVAGGGSTQYAIDRWAPAGIINIGTCGGFKGYVTQGEVLLAKKTIIYDIFEQMTDPVQAIDRYSVNFNLDWLPEPPPQKVRVGTLLSADRDINPVEVPALIEKYQAYAADWESGAIAWVAQRNRVPCLILRAVSDLVDEKTSQAYGDYSYFETQCQAIMAEFAQHLSAWIKAFGNEQGQKNGGQTIPNSPQTVE